MALVITTLGVLATLAPLAAFSVRRERQKQRRARIALARAQDTGAHEPMSLHPVIDPSACLGCGGCVTACPEGDILMLIEGRARLVHGSHCVGHGACKEACPNDAIELVFGTATRGVQIPEVAPDYQSNVPGVYIVGELGGMGLIRNAIGQGLQAVTHIAAALPQKRDTSLLDVCIVGAGPAGMAAALACRERGLTHVLFDQEGLGGSVNHYPRRKLVMTAPVELPIVGTMHFRAIDKEGLITYWTEVARQAQIEVCAPERVETVRRDDAGFMITTDRRTIRARRVVLAIGRRGTPRKLGVPGEDSSKVAYRLLEPERWAGQHVLVVGGGNSAVEAAAALAEGGAAVTLSYRGAAFNRVAEANQTRLAAARRHQLEIAFETQVLRIAAEHVWLTTPQGERVLQNDQVFVFAGGQLPDAFLQHIGVRMQWHHGERAPRPAAPPRRATV